MKEKENILFNILKESAERNNIKNEEPNAYNDLIKKVRPFDNKKLHNRFLLKEEGVKDLLLLTIG
ncbi:MAG TPA: hypothetical protein VFQ86_08850 [Arachidicoccus soli]|nr:hypothetical protein [Arachidicoccus soli]